MRKGYIKKGTIVGQDFSFFRWEYPEQIFEMHHLGPGTQKYRCVAHGYGMLSTGGDNAYGNGAVYTLSENIVFLDEPEREADKAY